MLIQVLICLIIYCTFFYIKNSNNNKVQSFVEYVKNVLNYDVDFAQVYGQFSEKIRSFRSYFEGDKSVERQNNSQNLENQDNVQSVDNIEKSNEQNNIEEVSGTLGIGGGTDEMDENTNIEHGNEAEQMEADANYIKTNYNLIKPINIYSVTSEFGERQSNEIVSANHRGIDLGSNLGTEIYSSLDGNVIEASEKGDFGKHLKIQTDNIVIIYAHCSKLMVKQGDIITKGQKIAEVGATGKATGPHLHFEIRVDSRAVNPRFIMDF